MKCVKTIIWSLLAAGAFLSACTEEDTYQPAEMEGGAAVYFTASSANVSLVKTSDTSLYFKVMRIDTQAAMDVALHATQDDDIFAVPSAATFAAGEKSTSVTVTFDPEQVEYDEDYTLQIAIDDADNTTLYGSSTIAITVTFPSPWTSLGEATVIENWFLTGGPMTVKVKLEQNDLNPNQFRMDNPFIAYAEMYEDELAEEGFSPTDIENEYLQFTLLKPGDVVGGTTVTKEDLVYYPDVYTGQVYDYYADEIVLLHPSRITSTKTEEDWVNNRVVSYQDNGLPAVVNFASWYYMLNVGGIKETDNADGTLNIVFPGVVLADYALEIAYGGKFTGNDDAIAGVIANLTAAGADVESIRLAVFEGRDEEAAFDAIIDGSAEYVEVSPATESVMLPFPGEPVEGYYLIAAVAYAGGEAQTSASATFKYAETTKAETWSKVGKGDFVYYDYVLCYEDGSPYNDEGLELFRSNLNPNRYKIEHWGYDVDFYFTYDAWTGELTADEDQEVGVNNGSYGAILVSDLFYYPDIAEEAEFNGISYYEDGTFHFALAYFVSAGWIDACYDTFTLTELYDGDAEDEAAPETRSMSYDKAVSKAMPALKELSIVKKSNKRSVANLTPRML